MLKGKFGRDAARIIVACHTGGWITKPTAASIERQFGIGAAGLKEHFRCHYNAEDVRRMAAPKKPKFEPFTDKELKPIIEAIKKQIDKTD